MPVRNGSFLLSPKVMTGLAHQPQKLLSWGMPSFCSKQANPWQLDLNNTCSASFKRLGKLLVIHFNPTLNLPSSSVLVIQATAAEWSSSSYCAWLPLVLTKKPEAAVHSEKGWVYKCTLTGQNLFLSEYLIRRCKYFFK